MKTVAPCKTYNHQWITIQEKYDNRKTAKLQTKPVRQPNQLRTTLEPGSTNTSHIGRLSKPQASHSLINTSNYEERLLKDCTFSPKINRDGERRSLSQFLKAQQDHLNKSKSKIDILKQQIEQEELSMIKPAKKSKSPRKALEKLYLDGERI